MVYRSPKKLILKLIKQVGYNYLSQFLKKKKYLHVFFHLVMWTCDYQPLKMMGSFQQYLKLQLQVHRLQVSPISLPSVRKLHSYKPIQEPGLLVELMSVLLLFYISFVQVIWHHRQKDMRTDQFINSETSTQCLARFAKEGSKKKRAICFRNKNTLAITSRALVH